MPRSRMGRGPESLSAAHRYATPGPRLAPIRSHLGAPGPGSVGTGPGPRHGCVDDDPARSMLYDRTAPPLTLGTGIALVVCLSWTGPRRRERAWRAEAAS